MVARHSNYEYKGYEAIRRIWRDKHEHLSQWKSLLQSTVSRKII